MDAEQPKSLTAKDARELAGLSYRQLNDWDERGALPGERSKENGWRRFTPKQLFALMVAKEIRDSYGVPVEKIRFVTDFMMKEGHDHLAAAIRLMEHGLHVFLLTDLEETFLMDSDLEFTDLMEYGWFRAQYSRPFIFLRVNELVNRLLPYTTQRREIHASEQLYRARAEFDASLRVHTVAERDLLQAIRGGDTKQIEVGVKDGEIKSINTEVNVELENLVVSKGVVSVELKQDFEDLTITTRDGKIVKARRNLPRRYKKKENQPVLFVLQMDRVEDELPAD